VTNRSKNKAELIQCYRRFAANVLVSYMFLKSHWGHLKKEILLTAIKACKITRYLMKIYSIR